MSVIAVGLAVCVWILPLSAQSPLEAARTASNAGKLTESRQLYQQWLQGHPQDMDAAVASAFVALRLGLLAEAEDLFRKVVGQTPRYSDARFGLGLCFERSGKLAEAKTAFRAALDLDPSREEFRAAMLRIQKQLPDAPPPVQKPAVLELPFRVDAQGFQVKQGTGWARLFVKGINLGAALPGKHPSEFPDKRTYETWIREMGECGFNAIRVYTIHPPVFYDALKEYNRKAARPIYLIHGVWAEPPPEDEFTDPVWFGEWQKEMRDVVDLLHGRANLPERPGHADGVYRSDISPWVLAIILGREWEPFNVVAFNDRHPGLSDWAGRFVRSRNGHATEHFMAQAMEAFLAYEHDTYHAQRPMAFTNWPTLDPLHHPTESTKEEEQAWRKKLGLPLEQGQEILEYDNDALGLDMEKYADGPLLQAGLFASYHAYPYYPDFMNLDPGYSQGRDRQGRNNYMAYLQDLLSHHRKHAVLISEFGVPSSRLVAHWQPQGMTHGGMDEQQQGAQDARMFSNIHEAGCAGGVLFAWIDEWFKKNWLVIEFETPLERKPLWWNDQDAEEAYGLIALPPGAEGPSILIDGRSSDWAKVPVYLEGQDMKLKLLGDEGWLHLGIFWEGPLDFGKEGFLVGLDTLDAKRGDHRLPWMDLQSESGLEFVARFQGPRTAVYVDAPYDLFTHRYNRPFRSVDNAGGQFLMPRTESNRARIGRDGTRFSEHRQEIGWLRKGTQDRQNPAFDSRAEWLDGQGFLEARIPWGLLNVTDPSSRRVVDDPVPPHPGEVGTSVTEGFRLSLIRFRGAVDTSVLKPVGTLPAASHGTIPAPPIFTWMGWEQPRWHIARKLSYEMLRKALTVLPETPRSRNTQ